ncbi:MAG: glycosyltransferase family 39 protein [Bacteroidetes bacterium]|nr:glycosyltransferase family 39 protein [Bacteroidota bacterium]MCL2302527.1 glycosyltransferase family 39 protein [Lentimicrobiaceae bacterium]
MQPKAKEKPLIKQGIRKSAGWKPYLVFVIFTFVLYSNTLNHFFVFDDGMVIAENKFTQQGVKGIPDILKYDTFVGHLMHIHNETDADHMQEQMKFLAGGRYRPLSVVTFALEVEFFGKSYTYPDTNYVFKGNAFVSHLVNILLYVFTICLLFLILHRLFPPEKDKKWYLSFPFIVTLLFLVHPIHTEVVANIKGRDEMMMLLGSLAALWFTIKYFDTHKIHNLLWSGLCLFLGLLSKENAITFLAVIPITIYYFVDRNIGKIVKSMLPLIVASTLFLFIRGAIIGFMNASEIYPDLLNDPFLNATKGETLATIFYTLLIYVKLLFFPHPLTYDYYPYHIEIVNWSNPVAIFSLMFYLGITLYAIYGLIKKRDIISYSIWFYLLPLSVVSNLFFPIGAFMGERFVFISSIGFSIFIGWLICNYLPKLTKNTKSATYLTVCFMVIILCLFAVKTISRNQAWKDSFTLYKTDIKTSKNSVKGNYLHGYDLLKKATYPSNEKQRNELCEEAAKHLKRAVKLYPGHADAIEKLGNLYFDCYKDVAKALHYYTMALKLNTENIAVLNSIKIILDQTDNLLAENRITSTLDDLIQSYDELLSIKPDLGEVYYVKGLIYGKYLNNNKLALDCFEKALVADFLKTAKFYEDAGTIYALSGNYEKALHYLLKAIELGSDDYITYINVGVIYQQLGNSKNAHLYMQKGNEIKETKKIAITKL